jgi:hypothetical protein
MGNMSRRGQSGRVLRRAMAFALWADAMTRAPSTDEVVRRFGCSRQTAETLRAAWFDLHRPELAPCIAEKFSDIAQDMRFAAANPED